MNYLMDRYKGLVDADMMVRFSRTQYGYPQLSPTYHELRDMFSDGQIYSKFHLLSRLERVFEREGVPKTILVVGGWYGTLSYFLARMFPDSRVTNLDIDGRCGEFIKHTYPDVYHLKYLTMDMYHYDYVGKPMDLVVNTSMEHIPDQEMWLDMMPEGQLLALQSNNYEHEQHVSLAESLRHFRTQCNLSQTEEAVMLKFPMYERYTLIGRK